MVTEKEIGEEVNGKNIISSFYCLGDLKKYEFQFGEMEQKV